MTTEFLHLQTCLKISLRFTWEKSTKLHWSWSHYNNIALITNEAIVRIVKTVKNFEKLKVHQLYFICPSTRHKTHKQWEDGSSFFSQWRILTHYHISVVPSKIYSLCLNESFHPLLPFILTGYWEGEKLLKRW